MIIWITGFSGAGKTSVAKELIVQLKTDHPAILLLDGDQVREAVGDELTGYDRVSRIKNAYRICRLAKMAESQGLLVVVSTMSLFHEVHQWNRANFEDYIEVYLRVDLDVLCERNARELYSRVSSGQAENVVGIDLMAEEPREPDVILCNNSHRETFQGLAQEIIDHWAQRTARPVSV